MPNISVDPSISVDDLLVVANFIFWQEDHSVWGGVKQPKAEEAFSRIVGIPRETLRKIIKNEN